MIKCWLSAVKVLDIYGYGQNNTKKVNLYYSYVIPNVQPAKRQKVVRRASLNYTERHIVEENPSYDELKEWVSKSGLPLKKFFNTSGLLYKEMKLKDKLPTMSEDKQLQLLATNGMLVKRPLVIGDEAILVGFKENEWSEKLK